MPGLPGCRHRRQRVRRQARRRAPGDEPAPLHAAPRLRRRPRAPRRRGRRASSRRCSRSAGVRGVVYADAMDPRGLGLLTWSEDPAHFVRAVRPLFARRARERGDARPYAMIGRTYATGHEPDLEHVLLRRAIENVHERDATRGTSGTRCAARGAFARLDPHEQGAHPARARADRHGLRRRPGARARRPPRVPRPRRRRQRVRHRPRRPRAPPALAPRADDAQDAPDLASSSPRWARSSWGWCPTATADANPLSSSPRSASPSSPPPRAEAGPYGTQVPPVSAPGVADAGCAPASSADAGAGALVCEPDGGETSSY